ncbi:DnaJ domain protein [Hyella patelloides LEGE 07179]|uniref:DnaJ domain protein n=1 Tax=Hyella patelloides LEGE 07179 TaxID=945734 RepID=A0A563W3E3_9CYAN|nr:DnaJ domain-containing protein [Hyella patelloides]VEP18196.1 DnaJ domain protein [Hyella patelloides LEGE 07179]
MMANKTDYYSILQVSPKATPEDIKTSFRRLARQYHPDLNPHNPETIEHFKQISEAYEILSDKIKRRRYDSDLRLQQKQHSYQKKQTYTSRPRKSEPVPETQNSNAQDCFFRGVAKSKNKQYQIAIKEYSKAIELDPKFIDAYLKRSEIRYKLGDNQGVLDDCYRVIQIKSSVPKAYYYQGRARFSLGYVQAAVDSYSRAISQEQNYAQAYYYRGIAYQDLRDHLSAIEDWQVAAELFRAEGNYGAYSLTKKKINSLGKSSFTLGWIYSQIVELSNNALVTLISYIFNPVGGLLPAFARLSYSQAMGVALIYGVVADLCLTGSSYLLVETSQQLLPAVSSLSVGQLLFLNFFPFIGLTLISGVLRLIDNTRGNLAQDMFLAGTSFLPLGLSFLAMGFIATPQGTPVFPLLTLLIFGFSYGILTLYTNCTQILKFSEAKSTLLVPLMTAISLGFYYLTQYFLSS